MIDIPTLLGCSAAVFAIIAGLFFFFWLKDGRPPSYVWFGMPFALALCSTVLLVTPSTFPGHWGIRLGSFFIVLAYAFAWQAIRALYQRPFFASVVLLPPLLWLVLSATVIESFDLFALSSSLRALLYAFYNGLCAYEFWRRRDEEVTSRPMLFWLFCVYAALALARAPFTAYLPAPLGVLPTTAWAVVLYNLLALVQALLASALLISMSRERVSLMNYRLAIIDPLTGVFNRRALDICMEEGLDKRGPLGAMTVLLFDLDRFKSINDRFGHGIGDEVILAAAQTAEKCLRKDDKIFRIGGEEFVCLLPQTDGRDALAIAERLRVSFERNARTIQGLPVRATISIGLAAASDASVSLPTLIEDADRALYRAKNSGRNQTASSSLVMAEQS